VTAIFVLTPTSQKGPSPRGPSSNAIDASLRSLVLRSPSLPVKVRLKKTFYTLKCHPHLNFRSGVNGGDGCMYAAWSIFTLAIGSFCGVSPIISHFGSRQRYTVSPHQWQNKTDRTREIQLHERKYIAIMPKVNAAGDPYVRPYMVVFHWETG
jgi:hypothetical protein